MTKDSKIVASLKWKSQNHMNLVAIKMDKQHLVLWSVLLRSFWGKPCAINTLLTLLNVFHNVTWKLDCFICPDCIWNSWIVGKGNLYVYDGTVWRNTDLWIDRFCTKLGWTDAALIIVLYMCVCNVNSHCWWYKYCIKCNHVYMWNHT